MTNSLDVEKDIDKAVAVLKNGGIILYPTDTVWGLGCDATNDIAVEKLFNLKRRPGAKAMISLVDSVDSLNSWVEEVPGVALNEIGRATTPLTIILDSPKGISKSLVASDGSAAFRIPNYDFTRELCRRLEVPLVSTSANISGIPPAKTFSEISEALISGVDYICETGRDLPPGAPSRIVKISQKGEITVIR